MGIQQSFWGIRKGRIPQTICDIKENAGELFRILNQPQTRTLGVLEAERIYMVGSNPKWIIMAVGVKSVENCSDQSMVGFDGLDMNIPSLFQRRRIRVPTKLKFSNSTRSLYFRDRYEFRSLLTYIRVDICTYILLFRWLSLWMCPYRKLLPKEYFIIIYENIFFSKICFVY